jgi:hypothetical protein
MKVTKPAETVEVCDFCQHTGYLQTCDVCGLEFCLSDEGTVFGSYGVTSVCRECSIRTDVMRVCHNYAKQLTPIFLRRNAALKRLGKRTSGANEQ